MWRMGYTITDGGVIGFVPKIKPLSEEERGLDGSEWMIVPIYSPATLK